MAEASISHESFDTMEHLQNVLGLFDTPCGRRNMTDDQLLVITLARKHVEQAFQMTMGLQKQPASVQQVEAQAKAARRELEAILGH